MYFITGKEGGWGSIHTRALMYDVGVERNMAAVLCFGCSSRSSSNIWRGGGEQHANVGI